MHVCEGLLIILIEIFAIENIRLLENPLPYCYSTLDFSNSHEVLGIILTYFVSVFRVHFRPLLGVNMALNLVS